MDKDKKTYDGVSIFIHWMTAVAVIGLFAVGLWMVDLNYYSQWYKPVPHWHKSVGICLALLTIFRLLWKGIAQQPPIEGAAWEVAAAKLAHSLIYILLIGIFVSGYLISTADGRGIEVFNWFTVPSLGELFPNQADIAGEVHYYLAFTLIGLASLHALAALKHHFINKDNTLKKMLGVNK
ncbi:cytochrome b [Photobacterium gaetbulicola]|uniref:Putative cytochrome b561 n=1 Tax=Photobacterium gaetbulicola Gung47 TaxID=658445 RepID=A0A0C5WIW6_9GAMM|nr:cytochrome b [Photobacterium gaetbulicola]AJR06117.1 putative cytochrome b561 [Photobacterium gaetbulicola Gung47]PSU02696.1 cytochrome b [Photobacterium gaetbulicola]